MYGFAPFAVLYGLNYNDKHVNFNAALHQFELLYNNTVRNDTGLLVHGYDASKRAPWADQITGASPEVWGRSLAWYTTGLVDSLSIAEETYLTTTPQFARMRGIYQKTARAEINAICNSVRRTGRHGIWQVVDQPGNDGNFVEASATAMIVYALAKGKSYGYISAGCHERNRDLGLEELLCNTYSDLVDHFVVRNVNGTLGFNGTSELASLFVQNPDYEVS